MPYDITYMWNLKYDTNEPIYETETEPHHRNKTGGAEGKGVGEGWSGRLGLADANHYI